MNLSLHNDLNEHLINIIDLVWNLHPDHGQVILGDFNDFEIRTLIHSHNLKQVVDQPTRESSILDSIITNLHKLHDNPTVLAPLGSSDHNIIHWVPSINSNPGHNTDAQSICSIFGSLLPSIGHGCFWRWITANDWFSHLEPNPYVDSLSSSFTSHMTESIDHIFSQQHKATCHHTDKPWITPEIKQLIKRQQKAFHCKNTALWKCLKYKAQHEIHIKETSCYKTRVQHVRKDDCRNWWQIINKMAGKSR